MSGFRVAGLGAYVPEKVLTNDDLAQMMDTSDAWIQERTGINQRHVGGSTGDMAIHAGQQALDNAGLTGDDIDLVVLATTTPDQLMPATSATVQSELGIRGGAFDLQAVCAGFSYALVVCESLLASGGLDRILLIGSDSMTDHLDWNDRSTSILFGDGAGAAVLERSSQKSILGFDFGADGTTRHIGFADHDGKIKMDGREVFRTAVRAVAASTKQAIENAGLGVDDIDWFIPHQANARIIEAISGRIGLPTEKAIVHISDVANTSSASIPLALEAATSDGRISSGDTLLISGFGFGMAWASAVVKWETP